MTARVEEALLHPWRRVRELGRGAMGAVYEAVHVETGERRALKLLLATQDTLDPDDLARFAREAELASRLAHPHLARVHGWRTAPWPPYLLLELLPGGTLLERLAQGPLPPAEARRIAEQLADGLAHAHAQGVVHRDLKPGNVMFDERGRPRITDFGLARDLIAVQGLTRTGEMIGTPVYMSPEQALDAKRADPLSDVYGLGAVLYAMLAGQPPIHGVSSLVEAVDKLTSDRPIPPPSSLNPGIPPELEAVCLRALEKDPEDRWPDAAAFRDALREVGDEGKRATAKRPRPRKVAGLAALWLLVAGATAAGVTWMARRTDAGAGTTAVPSSGAPEATPGPGPAIAATEAPLPPLLAPREDGGWPDLVHTHGWCQPGSTDQAWLSLALEVTERAGGRVRLVARRARLLLVAGESTLSLDTNPSARTRDADELEAAGRALDRLMRETELVLELDAAGAVVAYDATGPWLACMRELSASLGGILPGITRWADCYGGKGLERTWKGSSSLARSSGDQTFQLGTRDGEWAAWGEEGEVESLARVDLVLAHTTTNFPDFGELRPNRPIHELANAHAAWRGHVSSANASRGLLFVPAGEMLFVPARALILPEPDRGPCVDPEGEPYPAFEQVSAVRPAVAHAWPWGPALASLPRDGRWLVSRRLGAWTALAWGGGTAWVPSEALGPASGELVRVSTREDPVYVTDEAGEAGQLYRRAVVPFVAPRGQGALVWFDERRVTIPRGTRERAWWEPRYQ